ILLADRVSATLEAHLRRAAPLQAEIPLLVVDDGTKENAAKIAADLGLAAVRHPAPFGRAQALRSGVLFAAKEKSILLASADDPSITEVLPALAAAMERHESALVVDFSSRLSAATGLLRAWARGHGPAYGLPLDVARELPLPLSARGPEPWLLLLVARGRLR